MNINEYAVPRIYRLQSLSIDPCHQFIEVFGSLVFSGWIPFLETLGVSSGYCLPIETMTCLPRFAHCSSWLRSPAAWKMWKRLWQLVTKGSNGAKQANMFRICKTNNMFFFACSVCCFQSRTWSVMWLWIILHRRCHVWAVRLWRAPLRLQWVDGELWLMQLPTERGVGAECDQKPRRLKHLKNVNTSGWKMLNAEDVSAFLRVAGCDCAFAEATSFRPLPKVSAARATSLSRSLYVQSFAGADAHEAVQNVQCLGTAVPLLSHLELRGMPRNVSEWNVYWCN